MPENSRRRRLVARLAHDGRGGWADELRVLPPPPEGPPAPAPPFAAPEPAPEPAPETDADVRLLPRADPPPRELIAPEPAPAPDPAGRTAARHAAANAGRAANTGPLPDPLPPPLDAAVRALREDLLVSGGDAAGLADEICARHRDRLRDAMAVPGPAGSAVGPAPSRPAGF